VTVCVILSLTPLASAGHRRASNFRSLHIHSFNCLVVCSEVIERMDVARQQLDYIVIFVAFLGLLSSIIEARPDF
jgi:hypothetical protein